MNLILEAYDDFNPQRRRYKIKTFIRYLKKTRWKELRSYPVGKSRKTITEILEAHGLYQRKRRAKKYDAGGGKIQRFYPGAQIGVDSKEMQIEFADTDYRFKLEMAQDLASEKITAYKVSEEEDAATVGKMVKAQEQTHGTPLEYLSDNGSANKAASTETFALWDYIFPYHPQTNGILEGEFSNLEKVVGKVKIQGSNEKEMAKNILEEIVGVYVTMRNVIPRCSKCPFTPQELMKYQPPSEEKEQAWKMLQQRQVAREQERLQKIDPDYVELCQRIIHLHKLNLFCSREEYIRKLSRFDREVLLKAEEEFAVYSQRESFQESKRNGSYFYAIVKAKQREKDEERRKEHLRKRYVFEEKRRREKEKEHLQKSEEEARKRLEKNPVEYVVEWMKTGFSLKDPVLREKFSVFREKVREALARILRVRRWKDSLQRLKRKLMALVEFSLETRKEMINYINSEVVKLQSVG